ncbi:MAG: hypothetical protein PWP62_345 [Eubacteriaceae bacterium]|jgi:hypothetical protein|nr:hypothetical protein [Eubacteriaceae bacterium]MDK2961597.1 hypothetical protein [Eubacteriaceae bacterium]
MSNFLSIIYKDHLIESNTKRIYQCNAITSDYQLFLTPEEAHALALTQQQSLKDQGRIDLCESIIPEKIITAFSDSAYLAAENYFESLTELIDIFYYYKSDTLEQFSDDHLLQKMKDYFDGSCHGSLALLKNRELYHLARSIHFAGMIDESSD